MVAYTTPALMAAYLGVTFTPDQTTLATALAAAATQFIDKYTASSWQNTGPVLAELHTVQGNSYYLYHPPVVSVEQVEYRVGDGDAWTVADPTAYELTDPSVGLVTALGWGAYHTRTNYTPEAFASPPDDIALAATMIASGQMARVTAGQQAAALLVARPELAGLDSIAVGQNDISVKLSSAARNGGGASSAGSSWAAPGSAVAAILDPYKAIVIA